MITMMPTAAVLLAEIESNRQVMRQHGVIVFKRDIPPYPDHPE